MKIADDYQRGIDAVLWNDELGIWLDYDMRNNRPRKAFYPSNLAPLYTMSFDVNQGPYYAKRSVEYLKAQGIGEFMGGIPTSLVSSGEQWDMPNAWPPLQSLVVQGLRNTQAEPALSVAKELATRWLRSNFMAFESSSMMFEKVRLNY